VHTAQGAKREAARRRVRETLLVGRPCERDPGAGHATERVRQAVRPGVESPGDAVVNDLGRCSTGDGGACEDRALQALDR
jgi:hypothetical protein